MIVGHLLTALAGILVGTGIQKWPRKQIINEFEVGLMYEKGVLKERLQAGEYWLWRKSTRIEAVDMRARLLSVSGQELLSSDNVGLKISLVVFYQVEDPVAALHKTDNYQTHLYNLAQLALRNIAGGVTVDEFTAKRGQLAEELLAQLQPGAADLGLNVTAVDVKDIMFPGELKKIFAQVVSAQKEGQASLERARGESAALRNLANAAKMLETNPALLQLRTLQTLSATTGNTIVLGDSDFFKTARGQKASSDSSSND